MRQGLRHDELNLLVEGGLSKMRSLFLGIIVLLPFLFPNACHASGKARSLVHGRPAFEKQSFDELKLAGSPMLFVQDILGRNFCTDGIKLIKYDQGIWMPCEIAGLPDDSFIDVLLPSKSKDLLLHTKDQWGLLKFISESRYEFIPYPSKGEKLSAPIHTIMELAHGYIGNTDSELFLWTREKGVSILAHGYDLKNCHAFGTHVVALDQMGSLLSFQQGTLEAVPTPWTKDINFIDILSTCDDYALLLSQNNGLFRFDGEQFYPWTSDLETYSNQPARQMAALPEGHLAVTMDGIGLIILNDQGSLVAEFGSNIDPDLTEIQDFYLNDYDQIWAIGQESLFFFSKSYAFSNPLLPEGISGGWSDLAIVDGTYYLASDGFLLRGALDKRGILQPFTKLYPELFYKVNKVEAFGSQILVSTSDGLYSWSEGSIPSKIISDQAVVQIHRIKHNPSRILVTSYGDLRILEYTKGAWKPLQAPIQLGRQVHMIEEDNQGRVWIELGEGALACMELNEQDSYYCRTFSTKDGLPPDWVPIWEYNGHVYFTFRKQVFQYSFSDQHFTLNSFLTSLFAPIPRFSRPKSDYQDRIWIPSHQGCFWLTFPKNEDTSLPTISRVKDLGYATIGQIINDPNGLTWIMCTDHIVIYQPSLDFLKPPPFRTFITSIQDSKGKLQYSGTISGGSKKVALTGDSFMGKMIATSSYVSGDIRFQHFLEGHSATWSQADAKSNLQFDHLPPGTYQLRARAVDPSGNFSQEDTIQIELLLPFHRSKTAYAIYGLLALVALGLLYMSLQKRQQRKQKQLSREVASLKEQLSQARLQLEESRREAKELGEEKSRFFASMSHDLRTPMNGIIGITSLLMEQSQNQEQRETVDLIWKSSQRLLHLIDNLVDFARMDAHSVEVEEASFPLLGLMDNAFSDVDDLAEKHGLELTYHLEDKLPIFWEGDQARILKVLNHLVHNAVKFTPKGSVTVRISSSSSSEGFPLLRFEVNDTGIGIRSSQKQQLKRLFDSSSSKLRLLKGTGLGLLIAHKLVSLMRGRIGFDMQREIGSSFFFELPLKPLEDDSWGSENLALIENLQKQKLLLIDDNPELCQSLQSWMQRWGIHLDTVTHSKDAIRKVHREEPYDFILIDLQLKDCNPDQLGRSLRQAHQSKSPVLVGLSLGQARGDSALFQNQLTKPISLNHIFSQLVSATQPPITADAPDNSIATKTVPLQKEDLPPLKLLVVDDNAINLQLARRMLEKLGYRADVAENGFQAIEKCRHFKYDLIFMDIQMPELDGMETARRIREMTNRKNTPYMTALTARVLKSDREEILGSGLDDFLPKPINLESLRNTLRRGYDFISKR